MINNFPIGGAFAITWVSSGVTPSAINFSVYNGSETMVDSTTMTSSGNGHYYGFHTVNTPGYYVVKTFATIGGLPFLKTKKFRAIAVEVD